MSKASVIDALHSASHAKTRADEVCFDEDRMLGEYEYERRKEKRGRVSRRGEARVRDSD